MGLIIVTHRCTDILHFAVRYYLTLTCGLHVNRCSHSPHVLFDKQTCFSLSGPKSRSIKPRQMSTAADGSCDTCEASSAVFVIDLCHICFPICPFTCQALKMFIISALYIYKLHLPFQGTYEVTCLLTSLSVLFPNLFTLSPFFSSSTSLLGCVQTSDAFATPAPEASAPAAEGGAAATSAPAANAGAGG